MPECPANPPQSAILRPAWAGSRAAGGVAVFALDCVNRVNLVPMRDAAPGSRRGRPKHKWGPALLPAPTVAAAGTLAFQRLSSPRPSAVPCPSEPPPFGAGFFRSAPHSRQSRWAGLPFLTGRLVLRRPQFLTAWAWQSLVPMPPLPRCRVRRCCWRVASSGPSGTAPSGASLSGLAFGRIPQGEKGPSARLDVLPLAWRGAGCGPRSCNHRPCRVSPAAGRRSGIRNRPFRLAFRRFQNAPQHPGNGFIANFPFRSDQRISAFNQCLAALLSGLVPLSTRLMLRFGGESHKQQKAKLSTGRPLHGGQLRKLRNPLCFSFVTIRFGAQRPRWASNLSRSALSLIKPAASFWS